MYTPNTPSLISTSLANGILYGVAWFVLVIYGAQTPAFISIIFALGIYAAQLYLFTKYDRASLRICVPLSILALSLGLLQEMTFIYCKILAYPNNGIFPPPWLLALYPLFSLTLNSSLAFLNKSLTLSFILGGFGGLLSYLSGKKLGRVELFPPEAYPVIFFSWGVFLTVLIIFNRKFIAPSSHR